MSYIYDFWKLLRPFDIDNHERIRLGNDHDGGYVVSRQAMLESSHLISFGIGNDWSFEKDALVLNPDLQVFAYDVNDNYELRQNRKIKFFKSDVVGDLPHIPENSTLKIDIESSEWKYIKDMGFYKFTGVNQLIIEFHLFTVGMPNRVLTKYFHDLHVSFISNINNNLFDNYYYVLNGLLNYFELFHIHPNNSLKPVEVNGYMFPPLIECTFINKKLIENKTELSFDAFPMEMDSPNKTDRSDVKLQFAVKENDNE